jgi:hypothetical protein
LRKVLIGLASVLALQMFISHTAHAALVSPYYRSISPQSNHDVTSTGATDTAPLPSNFVISPVRSASQIPLEFYSLINSKQCATALSLCEGVALDSYSGSHGTEFLKNISQVTVVQYKDVTGNWGGMPYSFEKFYAVKVYAAVVDYKVKDTTLANDNVGKKLKRLFVVKDKQNSPWKLYMVQGISPSYAPHSWGLNLSGVTGYN